MQFEGRAFVNASSSASVDECVVSRQLVQQPAEKQQRSRMAWRRSGSALSKRLALSEEVAEALYGQHKRPVVALESTIISHGMPFPQNVEMARTVEDLVRAQGACPATICIADGELKVGLSDADLHRLAEMGSAARKCSTRDIAAAVTENIVGATTVSSTMCVLCSAVGVYGQWLR